MAIDRFNDGNQGGSGGRGGGYPPRRRFPSGGDGDDGAMYGRIPPQNIEAEMAVLGAMLLGDRGAIEKATEVLEREDFYREAHAHIYEAMVALTEKDEPVDIVTLKDELGRKGSLEALGGVPYLMALADYVPTTANVVYYANIVAEKAVLRRLIEASGTIAGMAYGEVDEVSALVDHAERTIFEVARRRTNQAFTPLRPLLNEAFEKIDTLYHERGITTGVDTGFTDLNYITSGLQDGELIILAARPSMGKCLAAWSLIDNPLTGERMTIEEYVKQQIPLVSSLTACGRVNPSQISHWVDSGVKPCWRVTTRTGRFVEVTGHHPFLTVNGWTPLHDLAVGNRIGVPRVLPVFGSDETLTLDSVRLLAEACAGKIESEESASFPACVWQWNRERLVVFVQTLFASQADSEFSDDVVYQTPSEAMAHDVQHSFVRLGIVSELQNTSGGYWTVRISSEELKCAWSGNRENELPNILWDEIVAIEPIGDHQVYDLTVPEGANFIAQDICVHNTSLAMGIGQNAALRAGKSVAVFSMEMSKESLVQRMICSEARVDAHRLRTGYLQDDDWTRLAEAVQRLWDANLYIDDSNDMNPLEMRAKCRRLRAEQGGLDLVIVDYLQLMSGSKKQSENRNVEITEIARGLKGLARELRAPVVALSQLSRAVEKREDKRPMLSDLRESGAIEAEADIVAFIYRPAYYERKEAVSEAMDEKAETERRPGEYEGEEAEIIIAKQRNGPTGTVKLSFLPKYARFDNLAEYREESPF